MSGWRVSHACLQCNCSAIRSLAKTFDKTIDLARDGANPPGRDRQTVGQSATRGGDKPARPWPTGPHFAQLTSDGNWAGLQLFLARVRYISKPMYLSRAGELVSI